MLKAGRVAVKRVTLATKNSLAAVGLVTTVGAGFWLYQTQKFVSEENQEKKQVLVLPFHSLKWLTSKRRSLG